MDRQDDGLWMHGAWQGQQALAQGEWELPKIEKEEAAGGLVFGLGVRRSGPTSIPLATLATASFLCTWISSSIK